MQMLGQKSCLLLPATSLKRISFIAIIQGFCHFLGTAISSETSE